MPHSVESQHGGGRIVEPDLPEGPLLRLADRGNRLGRRLDKGLRIDQDAGDRDLRGPMPVRTQSLRHVVRE